jgi:predicted PolB exonuclease-like 3'-5' exonuclease
VNEREMKARVAQAANVAALHAADHDWDVYAQLRSVKELQTKAGKPFLVLELGDLSGSVEGKVWSNSAEAMAAAKAAPTGSTLKLRGRVEDYQGKSQFVVDRVRVVADDERPEGYDPDQLVDPALAAVEDLCCRTLVFDIETVPAHERRELPSTIAEALTESAKQKEMEPAAVMGMSPFLGKVVSLAIGDGDAEGGIDDVVVLAVPPPGFDASTCPKWLRLMDEAELLRSFWALCSRAETVVSFNGKGFDVPFLAVRSLIHGIPVRVDLMSQRFGLRPHLDLFEVLGQKGRGPSKLDVICWALGIASPKGEMDGSMVAPTYERGDLVKIAEYNAHDVRATSAVYRRCRDLLLKHRSDWTARK